MSAIGCVDVTLNQQRDANDAAFLEPAKRASQPMDQRIDGGASASGEETGRCFGPLSAAGARRAWMWRDGDMLAMARQAGTWRARQAT